MKWQGILNEEEIRKTVAILKKDCQLFEVRIIKPDGRKKVLSGYFKDADSLIKAFDSVDPRGANIYLTLNSVAESCYSRTQKDRFVDNVQTTGDADIVGYNWLFVDIDPVRTTGVSSSQEELEIAKAMARKVYEFLKTMGFAEPVKAISGNGCHLLYGIALKNNNENVALVRNCLQVLDNMFSTDYCKIDTTNHNPSRICKLHGTLAQKGASTEDRPHRMSRIFTNSTDIEITSKCYLEKLAGELTQPEPQPKTYQASAFDLESFLNLNGLSYSEQSGSADCSVIYKLDHCPFNHNHTNGDAKIFKYTDGKIAFKCHHNSCRSYKWQDVRLMFEPSAYDRNETDQRYDDGWKQHNRNKEPKPTPLPNTPIFRNAEEIYNDIEPEYEFIRSGINEIDNLMNGFQKGAISVISGLRASGKSTLIGQLMLNAIDDGHTVVCYSGELGNKKYLNWLMRQAAGKNFVQKASSYFNAYSVPADIQRKIVGWMGSKFWLYDNNCGNKFPMIATELKKILPEKKADLCVIDNLMALDLTEMDKDKYEAQTQFVWSLKEIAQQTNTHIVFVAHPRKANGFLRLDSISGSGNISNIVDNAFIIHRWNNDFMLGYKETFKQDVDKVIEPSSNVIEIAKDRENGTQDKFISLYYEEASKRLKNSFDEYVNYGWGEELPDFIPFGGE